MKKLFCGLLLALIAPASAWANAELVQIVSFTWDEDKEVLQLVSLGSGTAIGKNLVITNKHVVEVNGGPADFLLLCPAQARESRSVKCTIPAGVTALHETLDAALVQTLDTKDFLPSVRTTTAVRSKDDVIRVVGFPVPDVNSAQNFGGTKTLKAFEAWQANPGSELIVSGDSPTTTRGRVKARYILQDTGATYTYTDAKVNFGNSGGAAFDQFGSYIGIPTLKDQAGNSFILEYAQMHDWVVRNGAESPQYKAEAYTYYQQASGQTQQRAAVSSRTRYYQQLRARQSSRNNSVRRTTSRRYVPSYYSSRYRR